MSYMFDDCFELSNIIGIENFNTSKAITIRAMFSDNAKLTQLDLSKWNVSNVIDMEYLFGSTIKTTGLKQLDISNWKINPTIKTHNMFTNASNLTSLGLLNVDVDTINKICRPMTSTTKAYVDEGINPDSHNTVTFINYKRGSLYGCKIQAPLRGLTTYKDKVVEYYGRYFIQRNCEELKFIGDTLESWQYDSSNKRFINLNTIASDEYLANKEVAITTINDVRRYVVPSKSTSVEDFLLELQENNLQIVQGIDTPQYEEISMPLMDISKEMPYIHADGKFSLTNPIYKADLKPNTTYTVIANYQYTGTNEIPNTLTYNLGGKVSSTNVIKTPPIIQFNGLKLFGEDISIGTVMILEGDWSNRPIPQYFEGIRSVGDKEGKLKLVLTNASVMKNRN
jgi:surface protein